MRLSLDTNGCLLAGPLNGLSWAAAVSGIHFSERPLSCLRFSECDIQKPAIFDVTVRIADYPELRIENWRQNGKVGSSPRARLPPPPRRCGPGGGSVMGLSGFGPATRERVMGRSVSLWRSYAIS